MATETRKLVPPTTKPEPEIPPDLNMVVPNSDDFDTGNGDGSSSENRIGGSRDESKGATAVALLTNDIQRKMKRAERFRVPVHLSEEEKRKSRAERFGTATVCEALESPEDQKRKARAERFGVTVPADEEAKKKTRLGKSGHDAKVDSVEEEKRKARALRFSQAPVTAALHINGNIDSSEITIAGRACGGA